MERLVVLEKLPQGETGTPALRLTLTAAGREAIEEEAPLTAPINAALARLLEWQLANGWELIAPEEIGALTDAPLLSDDGERDDEGKLIALTTVYWLPNYQILSEVAALYCIGSAQIGV